MIPVRSLFNTTNLHVDLLGSLWMTLHQLQKVDVQEAAITIVEVKIDFNDFEAEFLQQRVPLFSRLNWDTSIAFWRIPIEVARHVSSWHARIKVQSAVRFMRTFGFLMEYNLVDLNNQKKLWEASLLLDSPFRPRFKDEEENVVGLLGATASPTSRSGSFTTEYQFIDGTEVPMPSTATEG